MQVRLVTWTQCCCCLRRRWEVSAVSARLYRLRHCTGTLCKRLTVQGSLPVDRYVGVDLSKEALDRAQQRLPTVVQLHVLSCEALQPVLSSSVLYLWYKVIQLLPATPLSGRAEKSHCLLLPMHVAAHACFAQPQVKRGTPVTFHQTGMLEFLQQSSDSFDVVTASFAMHHLSSADKASVIREAFRLLAPRSGKFVVVDTFRNPGESRDSALDR